MDRACKRKAAFEHSEDCELGSSDFEGYLDLFGSCTGLAVVGNGSVESGVLASDSGLELSVRRMADESGSATVELHEVKSWIPRGIGLRVPL